MCVCFFFWPRFFSFKLFFLYFFYTFAYLRLFPHIQAPLIYFLSFLLYFSWVYASCYLRPPLHLHHPPLLLSLIALPARCLQLPFHCQWQDLKDLFRQAGTILRADVALGQDGRSRGFGTVVFATDTDAERAVQMFNGCVARRAVPYWTLHMIHSHGMAS